MSRHDGLPNSHPTPSPRSTGTIGMAVTSRKVTFSDIVEQDRIINEMETIGYVHYETINLGGNELLFRFRRK